MFDAIAGRYDLLNRVLSGGFDRRWRLRAAESLHLTGRETVLDLCTGTADLALAAAGAKRVIGIDFSAAMLRLGKEKARRATPPAPLVDLIRADITRLPVRDGSIDAVTLAFGIRNVEQADVACREIGRALRPEGIAVILEFSLPRLRVVRSLYLWYFRHVLPRIGRAISRHPSAYTYLPESVEAFASPAEFVQQLRRVGFAQVAAVPLTLGVVYMFVARKASAGASSA